MLKKANYSEKFEEIAKNMEYEEAKILYEMKNERLKEFLSDR